MFKRAFQPIQRNTTPNAVPSSCVNEVTPVCLQALYNIPSTPATAEGTIAVCGYENEIANQTDLEVRQFAPEVR